MTTRLPPMLSLRLEPNTTLSLVLFALCVGLMGWLRLYVFGEQTITLTYGLPFLICVWYPDRRLLWSMAAAFILMSGWKAFFLLTDIADDSRLTNWVMQLINILVIAIAVELIIKLIGKLIAQKTLLEETNQELVVREEEISRQNEELQSQTEELAQQNEEIQQQSEEVQQQTEELQAQAEELQNLNHELTRRQSLLEVMLDSLQVGRVGQVLPERICESLIALFGGQAVSSAILEKRDDRITVLAHAGFGTLEKDSWAFESSFASVIMGHDRTAFLADLTMRPDLTIPHPRDRAFRSILAAPLRINGVPVGSLEVYSDQPGEWTSQQFRIIEWVAAQCSLVLAVRGLQLELMETNARLDQIVTERTAKLQEMVNELEHFSYTITHDLRAPLRAMHGFSELLAEEGQLTPDGPASDYLRRIVISANRMDQLITDALSFSRVMREEMTMTPQQPGPLLAGMIESYPTFQQPHAKIEIVGELPPILANEAGLTQCFSNLLGNAVKFVAPGRSPEIRIHAERRDAVVRIWIQDNGIGIPPEMCARVFGMFQRLSKDYEGTGIGLALVKKVSERMGGRCGLESEVGRGSRFWIEFQAA